MPDSSLAKEESNIVLNISIIPHYRTRGVQRWVIIQLVLSWGDDPLIGIAALIYFFTPSLTIIHQTAQLVIHFLTFTSQVDTHKMTVNNLNLVYFSMSIRLKQALYALVKL